jgi:hypothetical protein
MVPRIHPTFDINSEFESFVKKESSSHKPRRPQSELVRPSGDLTAPILLHLHYHSMTTEHRHNGEIADETNCCIKLLLDSGFSATNAIWVDTFSRREKRANGGKRRADWSAKEAYPPKIYDMHLSCSNKLRDLSSAKMELVFGAENRKLIERQIKGRHDVLTLWTMPPLTIAAKLAGLNLTCSYFEVQVQYYSTTRMSREIDDQSQESTRIWVPTHGRSAWKIITNMLALEKDGAEFLYKSLPPSILEWSERVLGADDEAGIRSKYQEVFWEGGSKRSLQEIRDKWSPQTPPAESKNRQRQKRGSMQEARDEVVVDSTEAESVGLIKMLDRLSRNAIGSRTAQSYDTKKTYAYEEYLIRNPDSTLDVSGEHCGRRSVDTS